MQHQQHILVLLKRFILVVLILHCMLGEVTGQSVPDFRERLEDASTSHEFQSAFDEMITIFHAGKLHFQDEDVITIVNIARDKKFSEKILPSVYGWAGTMFGNGRMNDAIVFFMESSVLFKKQNNKIGEAHSYFEIALIQHKAENYEEAKEYYTKTLAIGGDSLHYRTIINCYNGLALILREQEVYEQAIKDFRKAYQVASTRNDTAWIAILAGNMGSIHLRQQNYDSSLFYYFRNLKLIKRTSEFENEIETYAHLGRVFVKKNNYPMALRYLDSAQYIISNRQIKFNDFFNPMDYINESYAFLYAGLGDYKKAFEYQNKYYEVAREKQLLINGRNLKQLQATQAFKQKQSELELLQKINEANVAIISQHRYVQIAFGIIIALISILAYIALRTGKVRKKLNDKLSYSNQELARLNRIKDQLFSVISHDLRGPLGNLQAVLDLYKIGGLTPEQYEGLLAELNHQVKASGNALENLLQWARAQLGEVKTNSEKIILRDIADHVSDQFRRNLDEKKITYDNALTDEHIAWADKNQVEIIMRNLVGNAIKFTPANGSIKISGERYANTVKVIVEDTGIGMTEEETQKLLHHDEYFTKLGTNQEKGTGMGLLICKQMIANNGGSMEVASEKNKGSVFTFTLPIAQVDIAQVSHAKI